MSDDPRMSLNLRASVVAATPMLGDAAALRALLAVVETRQAGAEVTTRVQLDIAAAMVDAHIEELSEPALTPTEAYALRTAPRCRLVVAALHYVASGPRVPSPDDPEPLAVLRWAIDAARGEIPVC